MVSQDWGSHPQLGLVPSQARVDTHDPVLILSICAGHLIAGPGPLTFFYFVFLDLLGADLVGL